MGSLTLITFLPLVGAVVIVLLPKDSIKAVRWTALVTTGMVPAITFSLYPKFNLGMIGISDPASFGITKMVKGYFAMFLLLETDMMGTFGRRSSAGGSWFRTLTKRAFERP